MSAVNVAVMRDRVLVITDTKTTNGEGVQFNAMKIATLSFSRLAIAVRGHGAALRVFERTLSMYAPDYDKAVGFIAEHFDTVLNADYPDKSEKDAMTGEIDLVVAGYGAGGPGAFWISNYQNGRRLQRIEQVLTLPAVGREAVAAFRSVQDMPELVRAQAAINPGVGGYAVCTEVGEMGISSYVVAEIDELASVVNRAQPEEEKRRLAEIRAENDRRLAVVAVGTAVG